MPMCVPVPVLVLMPLPLPPLALPYAKGLLAPADALYAALELVPMLVLVLVAELGLPLTGPLGLTVTALPRSK